MQIRLVVTPALSFKKTKGTVECPGFAFQARDSTQAGLINLYREETLV
jgi:hypothetical protein